MRDMLARARALLTEPTGYHPDTVEHLVTPDDPPRLFLVTDELKRTVAALEPQSDIATEIANAAKENAAMPLDTPANLTAQFLDNMAKAREVGEETLKAIETEQTSETAEFDANVKRLNDEMAERATAHKNALDSFATRRADAERMLAGIDEGVKKVHGSGPLFIPANATIPPETEK